jgi:hypothetical protein
MIHIHAGFLFVIAVGFFCCGWWVGFGKGIKFGVRHMLEKTVSLLKRKNVSLESTKMFVSELKNEINENN